MKRSSRSQTRGRVLRRWILAVIWAAVLGSGRAAENAVPADLQPSGRPIILVGLDAADWQVIAPLADAGRLPAFARLRTAGRTGTLLSTPPLVSPLIWTTIATGRHPEDHGVLDFMVDLTTGAQEEIGGAARRVPAFWDLLSAAGRTVDVVGWWATWPAESIRGTVVSDRLARALAAPQPVLSPGIVSPAAESARIAGLMVRPRSLGQEDLTRYLPVTRRELLTALSASLSPARLYENRLGHLAVAVAAARSHATIALSLISSRQPDLLAVYLEHIDVISHLFVKDPRHGPAAIAQAYREADDLLLRLARSVRPDSWILVCSDHGFHPAEAGIADDPSDLTGPATAWHRPYGIVAAIEAGVLTGARPPQKPKNVGLVTPLDLAPTLLHAAGLPVGIEMPGQVVTDLLPDDAASRPVRRAPTPTRPSPPPVPERAGPDLETRARLQALGYIGAATTTSLTQQNLGESLYRRGRLEEAERALRAAVATEPANLTALLWLAKTLRDQGRPREAVVVYQKVVGLPGGARDGLIEAVEVALTAGLKDEARRLLEAARPGPKGEAAITIARAVLASAEGRTNEAERDLRRALRQDPLRFEALSHLLDLLIAARRAGEAVPILQDAAHRAPASPRHAALLGAALLAVGDAVSAEAALERALSLAPDGWTVRLDLARAQLLGKRADRALVTLAPAPPSRDRSILMGAACAQSGRWSESASHYREALAAAGPTPQLLNGLGWAELKLGHRQEASAVFSRSLALDPDQPEIRRLLLSVSEIQGGQRP